MKLEQGEHGVLAVVDGGGRVWAQCAKSSQYASDYVVEGPLSGFVCEEGTFTPESEQEFREWLADHLIEEGLLFVKDREVAVDFAERIAAAACTILKDRKVR